MVRFFVLEVLAQDVVQEAAGAGIEGQVAVRIQGGEGAGRGQRPPLEASDDTPAADAATSDASPAAESKEAPAGTSTEKSATEPAPEAAAETSEETAKEESSSES